MADSRAFFEYPPLENPYKQIRLLKLLPSPELGSKVRYGIFHIWLQDDEKYSALSYVWGDPNVTKVIEVNDLSVSVTCNLEAALRQMRDTVDTALWVDALCINQTAISEKSLQVQLMSNIYQKAKYVLVWLGEASTGSDIALKFLQNMALASNYNDWKDLKTKWTSTSISKRASRLRSFRVNTFKGVADLTAYDLEHNVIGLAESTEIAKLSTIVGERVTTAIIDILRRPWWYRTWIVQELLLAKTPIFYFGLQGYSGDLITRLTTCHLDSGNRINDGLKGGLIDALELTNASKRGISFRLLVDRKHLLKFQPDFYPMQSLVDLMESYQYMECADLRDKIFAMVGIATDAIAELNPPDYSLTGEEIYERLLLTWIDSRRTLDIMTYRPQKIRPSWRPTFGYSYVMPRMLFHSVRHGTQLHSASLSSKPDCKIYDSEVEGGARVLHISGCQLDRLCEVGEKRRTLIRTVDKIILAWEAMAARTGASPIDFWHSLTADQSDDGPRLCKAESDQVREDLTSWLSSEARSADWPTNFGKLVNNTIPMILNRFLITEKGRIGLGRYVETGDEVCVLFGGQAPQLLREAENGMFSLIEDCYINGLMNGEAM